MLQRVKFGTLTGPQKMTTSSKLSKKTRKQQRKLISQGQNLNKLKTLVAMHNCLNQNQWNPIKLERLIASEDFSPLARAIAQEAIEL